MVVATKSKKQKLTGKKLPRIYTPPLGPLTPETSKGFECIAFAEQILGITLYPWQKWLLIHALELDPSSNYQDYRFKTVVLLVGRQNGKTTLMIVLGLWRLFYDGASEILSAAQNLTVAEGALDTAFKLVKNNPDLSVFLPYRNQRGKVEPYMRLANGSHRMELQTLPDTIDPSILDIGGSMPLWYVVATRTGGGRSYSADLAMLDELREHKNDDAWNAIEPTTSARPRSQIWCFSNAGDATSVVLKRLRNVALSAIDAGETQHETLGLFEWSAEPDVSIFDPEGWAAANPSLGHGPTSERALLGKAKQSVDPENPDSTEEGFRTEYLCQWQDSLEQGKIPKVWWQECMDHNSQIAADSPIRVGVDVAVDGTFAHIAVCGKRDDGRDHVEVIASRTGFKWVPEVLHRLGPWFDGIVGMQVKGAPSAQLAPLIAAAGFKVQPWQGTDMSGSVLGFFDSLRDRNIRHISQPVLDVAVRAAKDRRAGDVFIWDRDKSIGDASPLIAANIAWWLLTTPKDKFTSAYAADDFFVEGEASTPIDDLEDFDDDGGLLIV